MSSPSASSALYRLIEAGQLARRAVLQPLLDKGLEPGDDAVLFVLARSGTSEVDLAAELGLPWDLLEPRLQRLIERGLVGRQAVGPELTPGVALTERGTRIRNSLADHWAQIEEALLGELKPKRRRKLAAALGRFVELLRL